MLLPHSLRLARLSTIAVVAVLLAGCGSGDDAPAAAATVVVIAHAGPVCPVETDPPDPSCADRPVVDALIVIQDADGDEVTSGRTGADGTVELGVPAGVLTVVPQPVEGLLGTAPTVTVDVADGSEVEVDVAYDTGIR